MTPALRSRILLLASTLLCLWLNAQQTSSAKSAVVPRRVNFSGKATDAQGKVIVGMAGATFAIYKEESAGSPLWLETQNIQADAKGSYTVQLGASKPDGLPLDLFSSGEARWLGVSINGGAEQPRVLLLSVPYALKAADAETIGGLPPSAFVLAGPANAAGVVAASSSSSSAADGLPPALGGSGTLDFVPLWTPNGSTLGNSVIFQSGSGSAVKVGINITKPASTLDVNGAEIVRGNLSLPAKGAATSVAGRTSQSETLTASAFNTGIGAAVPENLRWQAEPVGNNTASTSASLNLLSSSGANPFSETGLKIGSDGLIKFASGQTFPGSGTVSSVGLSAPGSDFTVSGSPIATSGTLALNWAVAPTSANTANAIVKRDGGGSFSAGSITTVSLTASNPAGLAIVGTTAAPSGAVAGVNNGTSAVSDGVDGVTSSAAASGVAGINTNGGVGVYATGGTAVYATGSTGLYAFGSAYGVQAQATAPNSIGGDFHGYTAAFGSGLSGTDAIVAIGGNGDTTSSGTFGNAGINGQGGGGTALDGPGGVFFGGSGSFGGDGIDAYPGSEYAAYFGGDVDISGTIYTGAKDFKIDHPLDPANKYLYHASVESSEMMNIYTGNITTDSQGEATVHLPEWFEVVNTDFRYQLTVMGQFAQAIVARKIQDHAFTIRTSAANVEVSWQVTGVRQDAYAKAHPLVVEKEKEERLRGYYLHPELYGAPQDKQIEWARHPQIMKQIKKNPEVHPVRHQAIGKGLGPA
jgi:hypothetical protein